MTTRLHQPRRSPFLPIFLASIAQAALASVSAMAQAADRITIGEKSYEEVELIGTDGTTATFYSKQGPFSVRWQDLPSSVRQQFAKEFDKILEREIAMTSANLKNPVVITGYVVRKLEQGLLIPLQREGNCPARTSGREKGRRNWRESGRIRSSQKTSGDQSCLCHCGICPHSRATR